MFIDISNEENLRIKRRIQNYILKENQLYFKGLLILKLEERKCIVLEMHHKIGHFGHHSTFVEVYKRFYWHNQMKQVRMVVKACKECQMVKCIGNIKYDVEDLKNISIYDLFYRVELDIVGPFLEM
jgi:hypothetical protein